MNWTSSRFVRSYSSSSFYHPSSLKPVGEAGGREGRREGGREGGREGRGGGYALERGRMKPLLPLPPYFPPSLPRPLRLHLEEKTVFFQLLDDPLLRRGRHLALYLYGGGTDLRPGEGEDGKEGGHRKRRMVSFIQRLLHPLRSAASGVSNPYSPTVPPSLPPSLSRWASSPSTPTTPWRHCASALSSRPSTRWPRSAS